MNADRADENETGDQTASDRSRRIQRIQAAQLGPDFSESGDDVARDRRQRRSHQERRGKDDQRSDRDAHEQQDR